MYQPFLQSPKEKKTLIIDDFDQSRLNPRGRKVFMTNVLSRFEIVVIIGDESLRYQEVLEAEADDSVLLSFSHLRMREFGYVLRERLIEKWMSIGQEYTVDGDDLAHKTATTAAAIETLVNNGFLPSSPVYILIAIQQIEANMPLDKANGAYGYFYELLITRALSVNPGYLDLDTKYNVLAHLGWWLFQRERVALSGDELMGIHHDYCREYSFQFSLDSWVKDLLQNGVLSKTDDGFRIKYRYMLYYFVARYIGDNISDPEMRECIKDLMNNLHRESHANIAIFLTYLSRDPYVIEQALLVANSLLSDVNPCTLEDDVKFINELLDKVPNVVVKDEDHKVSRRRHLQHMDEETTPVRAEADNCEFDDHFEPETQADSTYKRIIEINSAFKTVEVLGQILRNFPGSLRGEVKVEIAEACYFLGMRTVQVLFDLLGGNVDRLVEELAEIWVFRNPGRSVDDVSRKRVCRMLYSLCGMVGISGVMRVANAVGSSLLTETYNAIREKHDLNSVCLINIAIRLGAYRGMPERDLDALGKRFSDNGFAQTLLRLLVVMRIYLLPLKREVKQSVCSKLGIELSKKELLSKKLSR